MRKQSDRRRSERHSMDMRLTLTLASQVEGVDATAVDGSKAGLRIRCTQVDLMPGHIVSIETNELKRQKLSGKVVWAHTYNTRVGGNRVTEAGIHLSPASGLRLPC
jgi:PilZ domain